MRILLTLLLLLIFQYQSFADPRRRASTDTRDITINGSLYRIFADSFYYNAQGGVEPESLSDIQSQPWWNNVTLATQLAKQFNENGWLVGASYGGAQGTYLSDHLGFVYDVSWYMELGTLYSLNMVTK